MRKAGEVPSGQDAQPLVDYLLTLGVTSKADSVSGGTAIWIHEEDSVARAKVELARFVENPLDPCYATATAQAGKLRKEEKARQERTARLTVNVRDRWHVALQPVYGINLAVCILAAVVTLLSQFGENDNLTDWLWFCSPETLVLDPANPTLLEMFSQMLTSWQLWRPLTPVLMHFSAMHLIFNLMAVYGMGNQLEARLGWWRYSLLFLLLALVPNVAQAIDNPFFGGLSGVGFGLSGFLIAKAGYAKEPGYYISQRSVFLLIVWYALCIGGYMGPIANVAHTVGFVLGFSAGGAGKLIRTLRRLP